MISKHPFMTERLIPKFSSKPTLPSYQILPNSLPTQLPPNSSTTSFSSTSSTLLNENKFSNSFLFLYSLIVIAYFLIGTFFFYNYEKDWTIFDSFYFIMITFLTIGFGDYYPTNNITKIFLSFYIFIGLTIIASGVKYIFDYFTEKNLQLQQELLLKRLEYETEVVTANEIILFTSKNTSKGSQRIPSVVQNFLIKRLNLSQSLSAVYEDILIAILIILTNIGIGILCHRYLFDKLSLIDSIYLSVVTITTLGYGDIVPRTTSSRGFTILYAFIGVISTAKAISLVNDARSKYIASHRKEKELVRDIDLEQHQFFDRNEFVLYKLTKMGLITPELRSHIEELFSAMDVAKSGVVSNHDIMKFRDLLHQEGIAQRESSQSIY